MPEVITTHEEKRGCGYRKPSKSGVGIYLVGPAFDAPCGRMPFRLERCPTCNEGIKPSRGWNWITPSKLFGPEAEHPLSYALQECKLNASFTHRLPVAPNTVSVAVSPTCQSCPLGGAIPEGKHGLIWIGEGHYPTPEDFLAEARRMGLSRKIGALPKGFELGKTVVYLAHRKAIKVRPVLDLASTPAPDNEDGPCIMSQVSKTLDEPSFLPGIFATFKPTGVDLVIADAEAVPERATKLAEQVGDGARIVKVIPKGEQVSLPIVQDEASP